MKRHIIFLIVTLIQLFSMPVFAQVIVIPIPISVSPQYEHSYLPGKKFPLYSTIDKYNFNNLNMSVELRDDRFALNLGFINCSNIELSNTSEFNGSKGLHAVKDYIDNIFGESNIKIDSLSINKLEISLEALDVRLIGFGNVRAHGLCQVKCKYKNLERTYCADIMDGDEHAPLGINSLVTRKTASRYMLSASIREVIEHFLMDLKKIEKLEKS